MPGDSLVSEFIIAGHSHMFALGANRGYTGSVALAPIEAHPSQGYFLMEQWDRGRGEGYWDALVKHSWGRTVVLIFHGNQHFAHFLMVQPPLFDFVDPMDPDNSLYPGAVIVPRRLAKASPLLSPGGLRELLFRLHGTGCRRIIVTGTPPVREDYGDYMDELRKIEFWRAIAAEKGINMDTCSFTPAPIMKRLWSLMQELLADVAREAGATFLGVPREVIDRAGYLRHEYRGPLWNFTHANDEYGRVLLKHIVHAVDDHAN